MQILLDTHYLLWFLFGDRRITKDIENIISDPENDIFYSTASLWEIDIKHKKHPDLFPYTSKEIADECLNVNIENLPIFNKHIYQLNSLKKINNAPEHNDPFDLMLLAQAKRSRLLLLTCDHAFKYYDEECILLVE